MDHKKLDVWKRSFAFVKLIYSITDKLPESEKFGLVSQMRRAAISIPSNISEGCSRQSDKELVQFLFISLGSLSELETQLLLLKELNFVSNIDHHVSELNDIKRMILGLIKYLKNKKVRRE